MEARKSMFTVQNKIRQNASQLQDYLRDMADWEKNIRKRDASIENGSSTRSGKTPGVRRRAAASTKSTNSSVPRKAHPGLRGHLKNGSVEEDKVRQKEPKQPAAHTYDKGYKRWESFDVDKALAEVDTFLFT